jgi:hypothetical protein
VKGVVKAGLIGAAGNDLSTASHGSTDPADYFAATVDGFLYGSVGKTVGDRLPGSGGASGWAIGVGQDSSFNAGQTLLPSPGRALWSLMDFLGHRWPGQTTNP